MQSLHVQTLCYTLTLKPGKDKTWQMAVDQLTKDTEDMHVLVRHNCWAVRGWAWWGAGGPGGEGGGTHVPSAQKGVCMAE